jgi:hypothetical protein
MLDYLLYAVIFFGLIWLLGAMFSSSKEGGGKAVRGCASIIIFAVLVGIIALVVFLNQ